MARTWLPFDLRRAPVVKVRVGADRYLALVDTGADVSMISPDVSLRLGLPQVGTREIIGIGITGTRELMKVVQLSGVGFGSVQLDPCPAALWEVSKLGFPVDVLLGVNAFRNRRIQFDFMEGRVYVIK